MISFQEASWTPLSQLSVSHLPGLGAASGAYAFRGKAGEVLYIGGSGSLRRRFFGNYLGGVGGGTTERIHGLLFNEHLVIDVEVAWFPSDHPFIRERQLKQEFAASHGGQLPLWNRRW